MATAVFVVVLFLIGAFALSALTEGQSKLWQWTLWIAGGCIYGALTTLLYFAVRRLEARQQERDIKKYRRDLHVRGSAHTFR
jgi:protein-S-isoprenylcysteine O-methyltransferase Ste14